MLCNDLRPLITKKWSGKLESFVHKLIKKQAYRDFFNWNKYFVIFQLQGSTRDSTQRPLPLRLQNPSLRHFTSTIRDYDTWLRSFVTLARHFDNSSQRQNSSLFVGVTDCRHDVPKWRTVEVMCQNGRWLKSRVEVKDFGAWKGVALVSQWRVPASDGLWNSNS